MFRSAVALSPTHKERGCPVRAPFLTHCSEMPQGLGVRQSTGALAALGWAGSKRKRQWAGALQDAVARTLAWGFFLALMGLGISVLAGGPHGVDVGWTVDHTSGQIYLTSASAARLVQGETGWIRVEMALVKGHSTWDTTMFNYYDTVVSNAQSAGLQVLMLIDTGSWPGGQSGPTSGPR